MPSLSRYCVRFRRHSPAMLREIAISARGDPEQPDERAPHHVGVAEPDRGGHVLQAAAVPFQLAPRRFDAHLQHVMRRRRATSRVKTRSKLHTLIATVTTMIRRNNLVDAGGMRALTIPPRRRVRKWDVSG